MARMRRPRPRRNAAALLPDRSATRRKTPIAGDHERGEKQDVVGEDGVARRGEERRYGERLRNQVIRIRESQPMRMEDWRVEVSRVPRAPRENPRVQERIAEVGRHIGGEAGSDRPRQREREDQ